MSTVHTENRSDRRGLQIIIATNEIDRAAFGLNIALTAIASDLPVTVFFAVSGASLVCARHAEASEISTVLNQLLEAGAPLFCCSACVHTACTPAENGQALRDGVRPAGLAQVVERASARHETVVI